MWSSKDLEILQAKYAECGTNIPELLIKFTAKSIRNKASKCGLTVGWDSWTEGDVQVLCEKYGREGYNIPELLKHHTSRQIRTKAASLHLKSPRTWTAMEKETLIKNFNNSSMMELQKLFPGRSSKSISSCARQLGLIKDELKSLTLLNKHIYRCTRAYTGTDGKEYIFVICNSCHVIMLMPLDTAYTFEHGDMCESPIVISADLLPRTVRDRILSR